jgi:hypothetical protein
VSTLKSSPDSFNDIRRSCIFIGKQMWWIASFKVNYSVTTLIFACLVCHSFDRFNITTLNRLLISSKQFLHDNWQKQIKGT